MKTVKENIGKNPFIGISMQWRALLIVYVVVYNILTPGLREVVANSSAPLSGLRLAGELVYQLLLFAPHFFYPPRFGWLHPLIFPTILGIGKGLLKNIAQVFEPLAIGSAPQEMLTNPELTQFSSEQMAWASVEHTGLSILSLLCYYGGFFFAQRYTNFDFRPARLRFSRPRYVSVLCTAAVGLSAVMALVWVQQHGGLSSYMVSYFGSGRARTRGEMGGTIFFVVGLGVIASLVWYAIDDNAFKKPLFWVALAYAIPVNFFITGSRSSVFIAAVLFLMVWMLRHQKLPKGRVLLLGFSAVVLLSIMGEFRRSSWDGRMRWDVFLETSVTEAIDQTQEEADQRQNVQGGVPVMASVPEEVSFLKGKSYAGAVFFFVPRFIWEDKPRASGGLNAELILGRVEGGGAVPIGPVAEAYWNFSVPGVVLIFFFYGIFHQGLVRTVRRYPYAAVLALYVLVMVKIKPASHAITTGSRDIVAAIGLLFAVRAFAWRRSSKS
jgi:hypothetical protein